MTRLMIVLLGCAALSACAPKLGKPVLQEPALVIDAPVIVEEAVGPDEPALERAAPVECDVTGDGIGGTGCPAID